LNPSKITKKFESEAVEIRQIYQIFKEAFRSQKLSKLKYKPESAHTKFDGILKSMKIHKRLKNI
jgi:hypothetical protein